MIVGATGLLYLKVRSDRAPADERTRNLTGCFCSDWMWCRSQACCCSLRETPLMVFVSGAPGNRAGVVRFCAYGKIRHFVYRYAALVQNRSRLRHIDSRCLVVKGGTLVTPSSSSELTLRRDEKLSPLGRPIVWMCKPIRWWMPLGVMYCQASSMATFISGDRASNTKKTLPLAPRRGHGGCDDGVDMPNTLPRRARLSSWRERALAESKSYCDFGLYGLLVDDSILAYARWLTLGCRVQVLSGRSTGDIGPAHDGALIGCAHRNRPIWECGARFTPRTTRSCSTAASQLRAAGRTDPLAHVEARPGHRRNGIHSARRVVRHADGSENSHSAPLVLGGLAP